MAKRYRYCAERAIFMCRYCVEEQKSGYALMRPGGEVEKTYKRRETAEKRARGKASSCLEGVRKEATADRSRSRGGKSRPKGLFAGGDFSGPFRWGE